MVDMVFGGALEWRKRREVGTLIRRVWKREGKQPSTRTDTRRRVVRMDFSDCVVVVSALCWWFCIW